MLRINQRDDSEGKRVKRVCTFYDERYGKNRSITDLDWSPKVSHHISGALRRKLIWYILLVSRTERSLV